MSRELIRDILDYARHQAEKQVWFATAIVSEVRLEDRRVRVKILPEELETNWIRMFFPLTGPDYMIGALPEVGTEIACLFIGAEPNHCYAIAGGTFDDNDTPPEVNGQYDLIIKPKSGGWIKIEDGIGITIKSNDRILLECDDVQTGDTTGSPVLTVDTFLPKYNADMALIAAHTNLVMVDPTLTPIGNASSTHAATKVQAK